MDTFLPPIRRAPDSGGRHYDVVILGGGPAGIAAALELKRNEPGLRILLAESEIAPDWQIGETLAPGGRQLLDGLGCWDAVARTGAIESVESRSAWGSDREQANPFMFSLGGNAWHLDRRTFNETLRSVAESRGVVVWRATCFVEAAREAGGGFVLALRRDGRSLDVAGGFVVDATGSAARFAAGQGSRRCFADRLVGVAALVRRRDGAGKDHATLVEACENGWWYSSGIPGGDLVLAWMSDGDLVHRNGLARREAWLTHLETAPLTAARAREAAAPERLSVWSARSHCLDTVTGPRWVAVGDAASNWDPLSSAGILKALHTGKLGAFVALDALRGVEGGGARYGAIVTSAYERYLSDRRTVYGSERRWSSSTFWRRRHGEDEGEARTVSSVSAG